MYTLTDVIRHILALRQRILLADLMTYVYVVEHGLLRQNAVRLTDQAYRFMGNEIYQTEVSLALSDLLKLEEVAKTFSPDACYFEVGRNLQSSTTITFDDVPDLQRVHADLIQRGPISHPISIPPVVNMDEEGTEVIDSMWKDISGMEDSSLLTKYQTGKKNLWVEIDWELPLLDKTTNLVDIFSTFTSAAASFITWQESEHSKEDIARWSLLNFRRAQSAYHLFQDKSV